VSSQNTPGSLGTQESRQRSTTAAGTPADYDARKFSGVAGSAGPLTQEQYVASTNQFAGSVNGIMTSGTTMPPGMDDYLRRANEMSGYLTWEEMNLPQWFHNGDAYPP
jgi:hypothetical protein